MTTNENRTETPAPVYWAVYRRPGDKADQSTGWYDEARREAFLARSAARVIARGVR